MMAICTITWVWTAAAIVVVAAAIVYLVLLKEDDHEYVKENGEENKKKKKKRRLVMPPGPRGFPIIGHLHLMIGKNNPHHVLQRLSQTHGPIMHLRFGTVDTVVASSPDAARLFLKTHDLSFASRPPMKVADYLMYDKKDVVFGQYGPLWREMRKLFIVELLTNQKVSSFESVRREELCLLVESLKQCVVRPPGSGEAAVDLSAKVASLIGNMTCRMLFGKNNKYQGWGGGGGGGTEEENGGGGFKALIDEAGHLASLPNLGDYFPILAKLDIQGLDRKAKVFREHFDQFFERILGEHEHKRAPMNSNEEEDFVDIILSVLTDKETPFEFTREHVKSLILDLIVASVDTTTTVILWTMSELIKNPPIMKKVKEEVGRQVGFGRVVVEEKDLDHLKYLDMVIKESLRLHPVVPLLLPHASTQDCVVAGFHIPEKTTLVVNVWAIGRDPNVWSDPHKFFPERFEGNSNGVDYRGRHFELIPFGSGRRSCPGMQLGLTMVRLVVAQLAHCFDWHLPNNDEDLDMTEDYGLTLNRARPLMVIPTYKF